MTQLQQQTRRLRIETPLGPDVLLLTRFTGHEEVSRLFEYQLELVSNNDAIDPKAIVGKPVAFSTKLLDDSERCFHGHVSSFSYLGTDDRLSHYSAQVV